MAQYSSLHMKTDRGEGAMMFNFQLRECHKRARGGWFVMFNDWSAFIFKKRGRYWSEIEALRWAAPPPVKA